MGPPPLGRARPSPRSWGWMWQCLSSGGRKESCLRSRGRARWSLPSGDWEEPSLHFRALIRWVNPDTRRHNPSLPGIPNTDTRHHVPHTRSLTPLHTKRKDRGLAGEFPRLQGTGLAKIQVWFTLEPVHETATPCSLSHSL